MIWSSLSLALREIRRNLLRSFLTLLGIVIGVAAVIVMVTLGEGATLAVRQQVASMGSNLLVLRPGQGMGPGSSVDAPSFSPADIGALRREVPGLAAVAPSATRTLTAVAGNSNWPTAVIGIDGHYLAARSWSIAAGRPFTESELRSGKGVCLLGETARRELFGSLDPIGERLRIKTISCEVVGLLAPKGQSGMGSDQDDTILMPLRTLQRRITGKREVRVVYLSVAEGRRLEQVQAEVERLMRERRRIGRGEDDNFSVRDMREVANMLTGTTKVLTSLLGAVASVSLLVGGIGIMNIMLVSVTERTREIGVRLAIGAREREVLAQFLVEAVVLSSIGGVLGILLALAASIGLADSLQVPFVFNGRICLQAFLFSAAVGVIFGFFPARRAARLDPIEALRHE
jgi:putative ABC transport system permease protein